MTEQWRPVYGWEGLYEVSDLGRVRSLPRTIMRSNGSPQTIKGGLLGIRLSTPGYPTVALCGLGRRKHPTVHKLVLEAFVSPRPAGKETLHGNGDRSDARLSNLRWGTPKENAQDRVRHGTNLRGQFTSCQRGHPFIGENIYWHNGERMCRACRKIAGRAASERFMERRRQATKTRHERPAQEEIGLDDREYAIRYRLCGAASPHGGTAPDAAYVRGESRWVGHCNRPVKKPGQRCWQHQE